MMIDVDRSVMDIAWSVVRRRRRRRRQKIKIIKGRKNIK
jgi:hypothetical protein